MNARYRLVLLGVLALALGGTAVVSYARLSDSRQQAVRAIADTAECRRLAASIQALRAQPVPAPADAAPVELTVRIVDAAQSAGIASQNIDRLGSQPERRLEGTPYLERPAELEMHDVTLQQTVTFLHALCGADARVGVTDLRLTAPRGSDAGDRWIVQVTAAQRVYSPKPATAR